MTLSKSEVGKLGDIAYRITAAIHTQNRIDSYNINPKLCKYCNAPISYEKRMNQFCSHSHSGTFNNLKKGKIIFNCLFCNKELTKNKHETTLYCNRYCNNSHKSKLSCDKVESGNAENSSQVRKYLISKHGSICLNDKCAWDFTKQSIGVELEHIDGNADNNKLENCTLLCPNCHSLTSTYKAKNKGNGRAKRRIRYQEGKSY